MSQQQIIDSLKNSKIKITLKRKDDTIRVLHCTLQEAVISQHAPYPSEDFRAHPFENLFVHAWDLDNNKWTKFNSENIQSTEIISELL